jgi:hypothetical protein
MSASLMIVAGTVHDTGRVVRTHARLSDVAGNAARVAAQSVTDIRLGHPRVDSVGAVLRGNSYLRREGVSGAVTTNRGVVSVVVRERVRMSTLVILGIGWRDVTVTRSAVVMSG